MCGNCGRGQSVLCTRCTKEYSEWIPKSDVVVEKVCSVGGCDERGVSKGMCNKHFLRWRKYGCTDLPSRVKSSVDDEAGELLGVMREFLPDEWIENGVRQYLRREEI